MTQPHLLGLKAFDLVVSSCKPDNPDMAAVRAEHPKSRMVAEDPSWGDAGAFLAALKEADLGAYDLVCRINVAMRDPGVGPDAWRWQMEQLLAGPDVAERIWAVFRRDPVIGVIVAGQASPPALPAGTAAETAPFDVFWAKPIALTKFRTVEADASMSTLPAAIDDAGYVVRSLGSRTNQPHRSDVRGRTIKLIAFYLPQFHPIPENDAWWGKGFTEWRQVANARPLYDGHRLPRLPTELGFYDLRLPEVRQAQADLARQFGIHGFCYYYYWFDGRRVLDRPLREVLASGEPDFPFCICWANENWTRRWDGLDQDILLKQSYSPEASRAFIRDVIPILRDRRYIRYDGKPILIIYRAKEVPDVAGTLDIWRSECRAAGVGDIHVAAVRFWDVVDVAALGFDAAVDFPPHHVEVRNVKNELSGLAPDFTGLIYRYEHVVMRNLQTRGHGYAQSAHRGVMLAWDNTPRRGKAAHIAHGATPQLYRQWLSGVVEQEMEFNPATESLVFINAWNEWAEGANLEPDSVFGAGFLEATRDALQDARATRSHAGARS